MKWSFLVALLLVGCGPIVAPERPTKKYVFATQKVVDEDGKEHIVVEFPSMDKHSGGPWRLNDMEN